MPGTVYKRNDIWWIGFYVKGTQHRRSANTTKKREAEKLLAFYMGQAARGEFKGFEQEPSLPIAKLFDALVKDCQRRRLRALHTLNARLRPLHASLGHLDAATLTERHIAVYIDARQHKGIADATLNCEMSYLHQAFKLAQRSKLLEKIPHIPRFKVENARQGFFERTDFERVVSCLPEYFQDFSRFGYVTGWRRKEIATLEWRDVEEGTIRLRPEVSKNAEGRVLIVVGTIAEIIARRRVARHELVPYVFHHNGKPISLYNKAWSRACKKAKLPEKLFHDLRRTAVRNMIRAGVPERIAMAISGHKTRSIFDRYNIVNEEDIKQGLMRTQAYIEDRKVLPFQAQSNHK